MPATYFDGSSAPGASICEAIEVMGGCLRAAKTGLLPAVAIIVLSACFAANACAAQDRGASESFIRAIGASASDAATRLGLSRSDGKGDATLWHWLRAGRKSTGLAPMSGHGGLASTSIPGKQLGALAPGGGEEARLQRKSAPVMWGGYAMAALWAAIAALALGRGTFASYKARMEADRRHGMAAAFECAVNSRHIMQL